MQKTIIILHGWGLKGDIYEDLSRLLEEKGYLVYAPDLPGFGNEPLKHSNMNLDDYVDFVEKFREKNQILKPILIGHSFGGRIGIKYTWRYPNRVSRLILTGVPIIRNISLKKKIAFLFASIGSIFFERFPITFKNYLRKILYLSIGEWDYYNAGDLKQVFKNIVDENLISYFREIRVPILLVWGERDHLTPVSIVYKIKKHVLNSDSIIVANCGHNLPYKNPKEFIEAINLFI